MMLVLNCKWICEDKCLICFSVLNKKGLIEMEINLECNFNRE